MKRLTLIALIGLMSMALWAQAAPALAYTTDVITGTGTFNSLPVSVSAQFIISPGTVEVKVWNNLANPTSDIQCLNGLGFVLSTGQTSGTITSYSATARTINKSTKTFSDVTPTTSSHWKLNNNFSAGSASNGLKLNDLNTGQVIDTIIGPPGSTNKYTAANSSIFGNHSPEWFGTAADPVEFFLQVKGVTNLTTVNFVEFSFGTMAGSNIDVYPTKPVMPTPVPSTILLLATGLLALATLGLRKNAVPVKRDLRW